MGREGEENVSPSGGIECCTQEILMKTFIAVVLCLGIKDEITFLECPQIKKRPTMQQGIDSNERLKYMLRIEYRI